MRFQTFAAQCILKPKISQYIDQWRARFLSDVNDLRYQLLQDSQVSSLVHQVQGRLNSLNISTSNNFPDLVQLVVTLNEIIALNSQKTERTEDKEEVLDDLEDISKSMHHLDSIFNMEGGTACEGSSPSNEAISVADSNHSAPTQLQPEIQSQATVATPPGMFPRTTCHLVLIKNKLLQG